MRRAFVFQLYTNKRLRHLHAQIDLAAEIYNHLIAVQKRYYRLYKSYISYFRLKRHVTRLKRQTRFAHWRALGSQVIQNIVWRIDQGYQKFFRKENKRPPTFRKRHKYHSITFTQAGWKYRGTHRLTIGGRIYQFHASRPVEGDIKTLTIKRLPTGRMMVVFSCVCDPAPEARTPASNEAGFDFGLQQFLTGSDGTDITAPQPLKTALRTLRKANRALSRKQKGSGALPPSSARTGTSVPHDCQPPYRLALGHRTGVVYAVRHDLSGGPGPARHEGDVGTQGL